MRVAYISDLHLEFRERGYGDGPKDHFHLYGSMWFPNELDADILVIAGDTHPNPSVVDYVVGECRIRYRVPVIHVNGNHDYWFGSSRPKGDGDVLTIKGVKFAWATLWTRLDPNNLINFLSFSDHLNIPGMTFEHWNHIHQEQLQFLIDEKPDVIITHHGPSYQCVAPKFKGDRWNPFFVSNLDIAIEATLPDLKVWIYGHTHHNHDFVIGNTKVVTNQLGYPRETDCKGIKIIDV
jgi:predicted phosphodiesterase